MTPDEDTAATEQALLAEGRLEVVDADQLLREKRAQQAQDIEDLRSGRRAQAELLLFKPGEAKKARVLNGPY